MREKEKKKESKRKLNWKNLSLLSCSSFYTVTFATPFDGRSIKQLNSLVWMRIWNMFLLAHFFSPFHWMYKETKCVERTFYLCECELNSQWSTVNRREKRQNKQVIPLSRRKFYAQQQDKERERKKKVEDGEYVMICGCALFSLLRLLLVLLPLVSCSYAFNRSCKSHALYLWHFLSTVSFFFFLFPLVVRINSTQATLFLLQVVSLSHYTLCTLSLPPSSVNVLFLQLCVFLAHKYSRDRDV